ncbi:MAG: 16S rRNA (adenine(1518)-N(6)/adenine(1519)-N(6))-dimethyltransferase RsmA [Myxococcota bacterium]
MSGTGGFDDPKGILKLLEQRARRRFGQHFLSDMGIVNRIVRRSGVGEGSRVLEIGPGLGILTHALVETGADVTAVELDRDLADHIERVFPTVRLVRGDAAKQNWAELLGEGPWTVVANLPYNVGTTVVMQLVRQPEIFSRIVVMLQKEVVDRMLAGPGSRTFGALSVQVQARAQGTHLLAVPPGSFFPAPKVHSSVIRLETHATPQVGNVTPKVFDRVVRAAFSHRRKTIVNSLAPLFGKDRARQALVTAGIDPSVRAEQLGLGEYQALAEAIDALPSPSPDSR